MLACELGGLVPGGKLMRISAADRSGACSAFNSLILQTPKQLIENETQDFLANPCIERF